MQSDLFYNTTHQTGSELKQSIAKAASQQDIVFEFLKENEFPYTASQISFYVKTIRTESVRRCLTNLLNDGKVIKLNKLIISNFGLGKPEHLYQIK